MPAPIQNSKPLVPYPFGDAVAVDGTRVADNFQRWFDKSKIATADGAPLVFHHGTGNLSSILEKGFCYGFAGQGNDQFGPGWYFTNSLDTAQGYTTRRMGDGIEKLGGEVEPGVLDVYLVMRNPIETSDQERWFDQLPDLGLRQAKALILAAPDIRDPDGPLSNWGDVRHSGFERVLATAVDAYTGPSHFTICNDFYREFPEQFLSALGRITGHDGILHRFNNGEVHAVAWFPGQIKAVSLNNGLFDPECTDVTDGRSARNNVAANLALSRAQAALAAADKSARASAAPRA